MKGINNMADKITEEIMSKLFVNDTNSALLLQNILKLFITRPREMTEEEIIQYLKMNRNIGVIFNFMPDDVKKWCKAHDCNEDSVPFQTFTHGNRLEYIKHWNHRVTDLFDRVICLPEDFKLEEKQEEVKCGWIEFDIIDGSFEIENTNQNVEGKHIEKFAWYDWQGFLSYCEVYRLPYVNFGGWQYNEQPDMWFMAPQVIKDNQEKCIKPLFPIKIRFWREILSTKEIPIEKEENKND